MTKREETTVTDVKALLQDVANGKDVDVPDEVRDELGRMLGEKFQEALKGRERISRTADKKLYFSEIGHPCRRKVWYGVHQPEKAERMSGDVLFKFLYGDLIEELYLALVRLSGHEVTDEQKRCEIELPNGWRITGRLDAVVDGVPVDVKSASTYGFQKFTRGLPFGDDSFGYRHQLSGYCETEGRDKGSFHVVDKTLGHMTRLEIEPETFSEEWKRQLVSDIDRDTPPERGFEDIPEGKSGNKKLGTVCSYCPYKWECWSESNGGTGLRSFSYSHRPVFLTEVVKEPRVPELTRRAVTGEDA